MTDAEAKARHAERNREWRKKNRDHIREYNKRVWARIRDSYEEHDRHCERQAKARRRNGVTNPDTMYTPHRGWRTPPYGCRGRANTSSPSPRRQAARHSSKN